MARKIIVFLVLLLFVSCTKEKQQNVTFLEINNNALNKQILDYIQMVKLHNKERPFIIRVFCLSINDSTTRYVISSDIEPDMIKKMPYHFVCKVGKQDVFFTMLAGIVRKDWGKLNFFNLKNSEYKHFIKEHFPNDYELALKKRQKDHITLYEPEMCYLTFVYDKLVKKEMRRGLPWW